MEITTEEQAAKVRSVMGAMILKLQAAKDAKDTETASELKAQYTTLQAALQEYKSQAKAAQMEERGTITALREEIRNLKQSVKDANEEVKLAQKEAAEAVRQFKELRAKHSALLTERDTLRDEVRWMRQPMPVEDYRKSLIKPIPLPPKLTDKDIATFVKDVTGEYPDGYNPETGELKWLSKRDEGR